VASVHQATLAVDRSNSSTALAARAASGRIGWTGPLLLTVGRSVLILAGQGLACLILAVHGDRTPWSSAGRWWTVYGNFADLGCLALLWAFTRKESISLRDLLGPTRWRGGRDVWVGLGLCLLIFPLFVVGGMLSNLIVFGTFVPTPHPTGAVVVRAAFPLWGTLYSLFLWWIVWTPTEQLTYQGYALPRLRALGQAWGGRAWIGYAIVWFWWSLQHSFLPFDPHWRTVLWRFIMVAPGLAVMMAIYLRTRQLGPMIIAQWPMDIVAAAMSTLL